MSTFNKERSVEFQCETRGNDTAVRWFIGTKEVHNGGRYEIQKIGYLRRLIIKNCTADDKSTITAFSATTGDRLKSNLYKKGKYWISLFKEKYCPIIGIICLVCWLRLF